MLLSQTVLAGTKKHEPAPEPTPTPKVDKVTCTTIVGDCDETIKAKDKEIEASKKVIKELDSTNQSLQTENTKDQQKIKSPLRNPFLMAGAGAAIGLLIGGPIVMGIGLIGGLIW